MIGRALACGLLACGPLAIASLARAQDSARVIPHAPAGALVRIESPSIRGRQATGRLATVTDADVAATVQGGGVLTVPWSRITRISVADGREQQAHAVRGAVIGLSAIVVAYPALRAEETRDAALPLAVALPLAGGLAGWLAAPRRWTPILWRPSGDPVGASEATRLDLRPETELVVRTGRRQVKARLIGTTEDSIALRRASDTVRFMWTQVSELRTRGGRNHARGAALGISVVAAATGVQIAVTRPERSRRQKLLIGNMVAGGVVGLLVGAPGWTTLPAPSGR